MTPLARRDYVAFMGRSPVYEIADLFSGAGGLTLGFTNLSRGNFRSAFALDNNQESIETYNRNFGPHARVGDIEKYLADPETIVPQVDLVIGGPPCQGFSLLNKKRNGDERRQLWRPFLEFVERSGARVFLMENVVQLLGTSEHRQIEQLARSMGFQVVSARLCAADYGAPQKRFRAFILGCRFDFPPEVFPPSRTHFAPEEKERLKSGKSGSGEYVARPLPWRTVRDSLADLRPPEDDILGKRPAPYDLHFGRNPTELSVARYRAIPDEGMNRFDLQRVAPELTPACWIRKKSGGTDLFGRLWWDRPSVTIRTEFYKPEKGRYLHPEQHRPITHREAARLQSFPDDFKFVGSKVEIARQIGNAVPPLLGAALANLIYDLLRKSEKNKNASAGVGNQRKRVAKKAKSVSGKKAGNAKKKTLSGAT